MPVADELDELDELRCLVDALTRRVESLQCELERRAPMSASAALTGVESGSHAPGDPGLDANADADAACVGPAAVSRRRWMRAAAAAAVGGTALALGQAQPVAAASNMQIGATNADALRTEADHTGAAGAGVSFLFKTRMAMTGDASTYPAALAGWSGSDVRPHGIHGLSARTTGEGIGVIAESRGDRGTGVFGSGWFGVIGVGTDYGVAGTGTKGSLLVNTSGSAPPTDAPIEAIPGALYGEATDPFSNTGSVWCAVSDSGEWRKLAGIDTAGSLHAINPVRVYDSRLLFPTPGRISAGQNRVVSVASERNDTDGAVRTANIVPAGATAVAYNVTIDATASAGFLSVNPGDVTMSGASSINWSATGQILANAGIVRVDGWRQLKVFCGGLGSTHFLIDITGYYL